MAEEDNLIDEIFLYMSEKKYPDGTSVTGNFVPQEIRYPHFKYSI